jgi:hypothetical protein
LSNSEKVNKSQKILPRNQRQHNNDRHHRKDDSNNDADEREEDPNQQNPIANKKWKLSAKEFRHITTPNVSKCPTINNKSICARLNITGHCIFGAQCHHSHDKLLKGNVREAFDKWFKNCKEQAKQNNSRKKNGKKNRDD